MGKSLSESLSKFLVDEEQSAFHNPFDDSDSSSDYVDTGSFIENAKKSKQERKSKNKKKDKYDKVLEEGDTLIGSLKEDLIAEDFDDYLAGYLLDDEDDELRRNLIRYGRKYHRNTEISGESSEIVKAYSESEKKLDELLKEMDSDMEALQKDITNMRMMRTRNYKALTELIDTKATYHNVKLGAIKEMNAMKKVQFELQMKADKTKAEENGDESAINRTIQGLFGLGRNNLISSYSDVSGSVEAGAPEDTDYQIDEDVLIQKKYFSSDDIEETDGDKFLKYEGLGVHYILLYDDSNYREIIAEDRDGNIIPDYPIPSNIEDLDFNISEATGTATDNLANQYVIRKV